MEGVTAPILFQENPDTIKHIIPSWVLLFDDILRRGLVRAMPLFLLVLIFW
jgi:hypothetical protein